MMSVSVTVAPPFVICRICVSFAEMLQCVVSAGVAETSGTSEPVTFRVASRTV
jgi:hypothetical protein